MTIELAEAHHRPRRRGRALRRWARRPWAIFLPGLAAVLLRVALLPALPPPEPGVSDEFSHLLAADTLLHGRLANPAHPHWRFFETIHVLSIPTYASKYALGQAAFLALGRALGGHPFEGLLLQLWFLSAATAWMLRGWVTPGLALLGGLLAGVVFGAGHDWTETYMGGSAAMGGAALVVGALGRIRRRGRLVAAGPLAAGGAILWLTRPLEGGALVLAALAAAGVGLARGRLAREGSPRFAALLAVAGVALGAFQAWDDWRVTGSPWTLPYVLHQRQYDVSPSLWPQAARTPQLLAPWNMRVVHGVVEMESYEHIAGLSWPARAGYLAVRIWETLLWGLGPTVYVLVPLALAALLLRRDPGARLLLVLAAACALPPLLEVWNWPHYLAPLLAVLFALAFRAVWRLPRLRVRPRRLLAGLALAALFAAAATTSATLVRFRAGIPRVRFPFDRAAIAEHLGRLGGRHVVLVRYALTHNVHQEWVYNGADIDGQAVVWARDLGAAENLALLAWYRGRTFWLVDLDGVVPTVRPYGP